MAKKRTVKVVLGDWSGDGHSITETLIYKIKGADVSNEALQKAREAAEEATGVKIDTLFVDYELTTLDGASLKSILMNGAPVLKVNKGDTYIPGFFVEDEVLEELEADAELKPYAKELARIRDANEYDGMSVIALLMGFLGYGIEGFKYSPVKIDTIVGGGERPLHGFGYGLYYP